MKHFIKKYKARLIAVICVIAVFGIAFFMGEDPVNESLTFTPPTAELRQAHHENDTVSTVETQKQGAEETPPISATIEENETAPEVKEEQPKKEPILSCTLSVRCDAAIGNAGEKNEFLPKDGIIFEGQNVAFDAGESVFDVLLREMEAQGIPVEFSESPIYQSVYIEGINNLYERDCGNLSGWIYRVNGETLGYDCSNYTVTSGDRIEWIYTCNLGRDV